MNVTAPRQARRPRYSRVGNTSRRPHPRMGARSNACAPPSKRFSSLATVFRTARCSCLSFASFIGSGAPSVRRRRSGRRSSCTRDGAPDFLPDLAILNRHLAIKTASDLNEHGLEAIALGEKQYRARFGKA
jgi:hypothetical protein